MIETSTYGFFLVGDSHYLLQINQTQTSKIQINNNDDECS